MIEAEELKNINGGISLIGIANFIVNLLYLAKVIKVAKKLR